MVAETVVLSGKILIKTEQKKAFNAPFSALIHMKTLRLKPQLFIYVSIWKITAKPPNPSIADIIGKGRPSADAVSQPKVTSEIQFINVIAVF